MFPKKLAIEATKDNMLKLQAKKTSEANKKKAEIEANKEIAKKIEKIEKLLRMTYILFMIHFFIFNRICYCCLIKVWIGYYKG